MTLLSEIESEELTPQERLSRVAAILAAGVLRLRRVNRTEESQKIAPAPLDVPRKTRLSVPRG